MVRRDNYFNLAGIPNYSTAPYLGTQDTNGPTPGNYYTTVDAYDSRGRLNREVSPPTGPALNPSTIHRTVYDGLSRVVSAWVGTNDTGATDSDPTGGGASGNNMVRLSLNVYDGGGVGDSDLTQSTAYPGGGAAARETDYAYDWRDRQIGSKEGVLANENDGAHRPIVLTMSPSPKCLSL